MGGEEKEADTGEAREAKDRLDFLDEAEAGDSGVWPAAHASGAETTVVPEDDTEEEEIEAEWPWEKRGVETCDNSPTKPGGGLVFVKSVKANSSIPGAKEYSVPVV